MSDKQLQHSEKNSYAEKSVLLISALVKAKAGCRSEASWNLDII